MIIVTGANGFIGSNLVRRLTDERAGPSTEVLAVDDFPSIRGRGLATAGPGHAPPMEARYERSPEGIAPVQPAAYLDFEDLPAWLDANAGSSLAPVEAVYHLGACSDTTVTDRGFVMSVNFEYTRDLWLWCAQRGVGFVYASSAATYGDGSGGYDDAVDPTRYRPLNLYGESKQRFDLWALDEVRAGRATPPRWAGLKYFNVYGPREDHKQRMASVAFHAFHQVRETGRAQLFESHKAGVAHGEQRRDFVLVDDACLATLFLGGHGEDSPRSESLSFPPRDGGNLFNVGTGRAATFLSFVESVFAGLEIEPAIDFIPMPEDLRGRYQYFTQARTDKLRSAGLTQPFAGVEDGVVQYVRGYLRPRYGDLVAGALQGVEGG